MVAALSERAPIAWALGVAVAANLTTHGMLWEVFPHLPLAYWPRVLVCELAVVAAEASIFVGFRLASLRAALALAFVVNAASVAVGFLVRLG